MLMALRYWIILAVVITGTCGVIYLAVQQDIRLSANDPQIELSEDLGRKLQNGANPKAIVSGGQIDLSKSLATFVIVFNEKKEVVVSNAVLDGKAPTLPSGVFDYTKSHSEDRVTWQPKDGVRIAAVIRYFNGKNNSGYVLVGRSLREVEKREDWLTEQVGLTWVGLMAGTFIVSLVLTRRG